MTEITAQSIDEALRKQLEYNKELAGTAQQEIKDIAMKHPQYAAEIREMLEKAENSLIYENE